jgi:SPP1 family predicted phage head-tail adaptor
MRNGKLRHKMTLQQPVTTQNTTTGEMATVWTEVAKVWASLEPLSANAFIAAGAEQSEVTARVTIRYREGVTSKMRLIYRGMYYDIKGVLADPKSGLEYLTLPVGEGVRYEDPTPPAPAVCSVIFTGTADVSGQTVSVTSAAGDSYFAETSVRPMPGNGSILWIEAKDTAYSGSGSGGGHGHGSGGSGGVFVHIVGHDAGGVEIASMHFKNGGSDREADVNGSVILTPDVSVTGMSMGIDAAGDAYFYNRATATIVKASDVAPGTAGAFAGAANIQICVNIDSASTVTATATVVTDSDVMTDRIALAGGVNWCGGDI